MKYHHADEATPTVKTLKTAGCDEIWSEMFKALKRGFWLTRVCQVACILGGHRKINNWGDYPYTQKGQEGPG